MRERGVRERTWFGSFKGERRNPYVCRASGFSVAVIGLSTGMSIYRRTVDFLGDGGQRASHSHQLPVSEASGKCQKQSGRLRRFYSDLNINKKKYNTGPWSQMQLKSSEISPKPKYFFINILKMVIHI
jgi:hypothetical protein